MAAGDGAELGGPGGGREQLGGWRLGAVRREDPDRRRERQEQGGESARQLLRAGGALDLLDAGADEAAPVGGGSLVAGMEVADQPRQAGEGDQIVEPAGIERAGRREGDGRLVDRLEGGGAGPGAGAAA